MFPKNGRKPKLPGSSVTVEIASLLFMSYSPFTATSRFSSFTSSISSSSLISTNLPSFAMTTSSSSSLTLTMFSVIMTTSSSLPLTKFSAIMTTSSSFVKPTPSPIISQSPMSYSKVLRSTGRNSSNSSLPPIKPQFTTLSMQPNMVKILKPKILKSNRSITKNVIKIKSTIDESSIDLCKTCYDKEKISAFQPNSFPTHWAVSSGKQILTPPQSPLWSSCRPSHPHQHSFPR